MKYKQIMTATFRLSRQCKVCHKAYQHRQSLARHMDRVHQVDSKTHPILVWWKKLTWRGYERHN